MVKVRHPGSRTRKSALTNVEHNTSIFDEDIGIVLPHHLDKVNCINKKFGQPRPVVPGASNLRRWRHIRLGL